MPMLSHDRCKFLSIRSETAAMTYIGSLSQGQEHSKGSWGWFIVLLGSVCGTTLPLCLVRWIE